MKTSAMATTRQGLTAMKIFMFDFHNSKAMGTHVAAQQTFIQLSEALFNLLSSSASPALVFKPHNYLYTQKHQQSLKSCLHSFSLFEAIQETMQWFGQTTPLAFCFKHHLKHPD